MWNIKKLFVMYSISFTGGRAVVLSLLHCRTDA